MSMVLNNPLGVHFKVDSISMYPYYIIKDLLGVILFLIFFSYFVFFSPNILGHPDNYIPCESHGNAAAYSSRMVFFTVFMLFFVLYRQN